MEWYSLFFFSNNLSRLIANFKFTLSFCLLNPEPSMLREEDKKNLLADFKSGKLRSKGSDQS